MKKTINLHLLSLCLLWLVVSSCGSGGVSELYELGRQVWGSLPSYDGEILNTIDNGTQVEATAHNSEWYKIKWKGQTVYIPRSDLRL